MTGEGGRRKVEGGIAVVAVAVWCATVTAADVTASATADRPAVRLSESVRVTLTVECPAPLRVELPAAVVDEPSADGWRVRSAGSPAVADLPNGRQRWSSAYRADPYVPGNPLRLGFAPAKVTAGADARPTEVPFPAVEVRVTTDITDPSAATVRPITGIETLPPVVQPPSPPPVWLWFGVAAGVGLVALIWFRRGRRSVKLISPEEHALRELAAAEAALDAGQPPAEVADRVTTAVRRFLGYGFGLPADRLTTAELLTTREWPSEVRAVLETCDRAKFADHPAAPAEIADAIRHAKDIVSRRELATDEHR